MLAVSGLAAISTDSQRATHAGADAQPARRQPRTNGGRAPRERTRTRGTTAGRAARAQPARPGAGRGAPIQHPTRSCRSPPSVAGRRSSGGGLLDSGLAIPYLHSRA
eukprot:scaffold3795_cov334-Prasinococcus_capsulatus_cf.AAC.1